MKSRHPFAVVAVLAACTYNPDLVSGGGSTGDASSTTGDGTTGAGAETRGPDGPDAESSGTAMTTEPNPADSSGPGPGESTSSGDESTGPGTQVCMGTCLAPTAAEWMGPFRMATSDPTEPVPICGGGWDLAVDLELFDGIVAPPADCECSCGSAQGVTCSGTTRSLQRWDAPLGDCTFAPNSTYVLTPGQCIDMPITMVNDRWRHIGANPVPQGGSCQATESSEIQDAVFSTRYTLCGEAVPPVGECDGEEVCVTASDEPLCLMADGDQECPGEGFEVKRVAYTGLTDARGCSNDCSCGTPTGDCSAAGVLRLVFGECGIMGGLIPIYNVPTDQCLLPNMDVVSVLYPPNSAPEPDTSCTPTQPTPTGEAIGTGTTTLCCTG